MLTVSLRTVYPCCGRHAVIRAIPRVPHEQYERRCCGIVWNVDRFCVAERNDNAVGRIDRLEWSWAHDIIQRGGKIEGGIIKGGKIENRSTGLHKAAQRPVG